MKNKKTKQEGLALDESIPSSLIISNEKGKKFLPEWIHKYMILPQDKKDELKCKIEEFNKSFDIKSDKLD